MRVRMSRFACRRSADRLSTSHFFLLFSRGLAQSLIIGLGVFALWATATSPVARAYSPPKASLIIDANSGRTLHASNARAARYPASLTKVMTLYTLFSYLRDGRLDMDTRLTVSKTAAKRPPSKVGFKPGDSVTVRAAIRLLVTKSANDVAAVIAENIAGSESAFAKLMTRKAREMGMQDTTFRNASGLPDSRQKTTAYDMSILAQRVLADFPERADEFKRRYFKFRGRTYRNHNRLLFRYKGIQGLKTGFIRASGFNVMLAAKRGDKRLIAVIMGGPSARSRDARARRLLNAAWKRASVKAPEMAEHLPRRNPAFTPSPRELDIRRRLARAERSPAALLFKHVQAVTRDRREQSARVEQRSAPEPDTASRPRRAARARTSTGSSASRGLAGPYHVQVGAYVSADDAQRRLESVARRHERSLGHHPREAVHADVRGREVFRARFGGFDEARARETCESLKRKAIDCLVSAKK